MVSLSLMARLVEAVRPEARLILVGDPGQLASIEAGVVLGGHRRTRLDAARRLGEGSSVLEPRAPVRRRHRELADAIR